MKNLLFFIVLVVIAGLWFGGSSLVAFLVDWNWFTALAHEELFTTKIQTQVLLFFGMFILSSGFLFANIYFLLKAKPFPISKIKEQIVEGAIKESQIKGILRLILGAVVVIPSLLIASVASQQWLYTLAFFDAVPFDKVDPIFGHDISFYIFQFPILRFVLGSAISICMLSLLVMAAIIAIRDVFLDQGKIQIDPRGIKQLIVIGAVLFFAFGFSWYFDRYELLFAKNGAVWGVGYTDASARIPGFWIMSLLSFVSGCVLLFAAAKNKLRVPVAVVVLYVVGRVLLTSAWPSLIQSLMVEPSELEKETKYLEYNIEFSRAAYALNRISEQPFAVDRTLSMKDIDENPLTVNNIRIWDDRPLLTTYAQIQEIRTYYDFKDVDVDRYMINGELRQVMLSARELNFDNFPAQGRSWVNEHFQFTHGYGLTMSPVNMVTKEGLPELFIQDIPPQSNVDIEITRPEIYYGEKTDRYVIVGGKLQEFDYPKGDANVETTYAGKGGVGISSLYKRLLFSSYFNDIEILFSDYVDENSKILFRRTIRERVKKLTPFLLFDQDPYLVIAEEGRMFWVMDAYTGTDSYPYSEPISIGRTRRSSGYRYNYIRNSVKVVVDAYNGDVSYYVNDTSDPLIQMYSKIFPNTFQSRDKMPESIAEHLRYPVDFFNIQAKMFGLYHMTRPNVFYNKEDVWDLPRELYGSDGGEQRMDSYYLIMKLPGEEKEEFVLLLPFVPTQKSNMIAWLAARSDGEDDGNLILYQFPKQKLIYGPRQIEARIDQDPVISQQITLWSQSGSRVVRGNLLVIPIEKSLLYVEPLYLQAQTSQLPELKRVIVSYDNKIAMEESLSESLMSVFGISKSMQADIKKRKEDSLSEDSSSSKDQNQTRSWITLAQEARQQLLAAEEKQRTGDWAGYGASLDQLSLTLEALEQQASEQLGGASKDISVEDTSTEDALTPAPSEDTPANPE
jgi:uncharacterized membrane protein (UPF0182 family)